MTFTYLEVLLLYIFSKTIRKLRTYYKSSLEIANEFDRHHYKSVIVRNC
jgi:hypothetical protein